MMATPLTGTDPHLVSPHVSRIGCVSIALPFSGRKGRGSQVLSNPNVLRANIGVAFTW